MSAFASHRARLAKTNRLYKVIPFNAIRESSNDLRTLDLSFKESPVLRHDVKHVACYVRPNKAHPKDTLFLFPPAVVGRFGTKYIPTIQHAFNPFNDMVTITLYFGTLKDDKLVPEDVYPKTIIDDKQTSDEIQYFVESVETSLGKNENQIREKYPDTPEAITPTMLFDNTFSSDNEERIALSKQISDDTIDSPTTPFVDPYRIAFWHPQWIQPSGPGHEELIKKVLDQSDLIAAEEKTKNETITNIELSRIIRPKLVQFMLSNGITPSKLKPKLSLSIGIQLSTNAITTGTVIQGSFFPIVLRLKKDQPTIVYMINAEVDIVKLANTRQTSKRPRTS